jgi:hypothetical protein
MFTRSARTNVGSRARTLLEGLNVAVHVDSTMEKGQLEYVHHSAFGAPDVRNATHVSIYTAYEVSIINKVIDVAKKTIVLVREGIIHMKLNGS